MVNYLSYGKSISGPSTRRLGSDNLRSVRVYGKSDRARKEIDM